MLEGAPLGIVSRGVVIVVGMHWEGEIDARENESTDLRAIRTFPAGSMFAGSASLWSRGRFFVVTR
jgi:hypothetical protein